MYAVIVTGGKQYRVSEGSVLQVEKLEAAEGAYEIAVQRYKAGLGTYLNVLTAETAVLNQRRLGVDLAARVLDARVALYRALGGGYAADTTIAAH